MCCFVFSFDQITPYFEVICTDLPLSPTTNNPLAVPGAGDGCHTHSVRVVNDDHEPATLRRKHTNLTIIPC